MKKRKPIEPTVVLNDKEEPTEQKLPSEGLGDTLKSITSAMGITPCDGCNRRAERLNKMFPWQSTPRDLQQDEKELMVRINASTRIVNDDVNALFKLYNALFNSKLERCNCSGLIAQMVKRINKWL